MELVGRANKKKLNTSGERTYITVRIYVRHDSKYDKIKVLI